MVPKYELKKIGSEKLKLSKGSDNWTYNWFCTMHLLKVSKNELLNGSKNLYYTRFPQMNLYEVLKQYLLNDSAHWAWSGSDKWTLDGSEKIELIHGSKNN